VSVWLIFLSLAIVSYPRFYSLFTDTATYYKQIDTKWFQGADQPVTAVPTHNPDFYKLPWAKMGTAGWGALLLLAPLLGSWAIGMIWAAVAARKAKKAAPVAESEKDLDVKTESAVVA
jgi:hypothetical protein